MGLERASSRPQLLDDVIKQAFELFQRGGVLAEAADAHVVIEGANRSLARVAQDGERTERREGGADQSRRKMLAQVEGTALERKSAARLTVGAVPGRRGSRGELAAQAATGSGVQLLQSPMHRR